MRLGFYAPLKSPDHATPSGDREIARGLMKAFGDLGCDLTLASTLRSRDGGGDSALQAAIRTQAAAEIPNLIKQGARESWRAWITYHNYYKAPDLLGPAVTRALGIPYVQIESTRARKRLNGPWADFAAAAEEAADAADAIFHFTNRDAEALHRDAPSGQLILPLPPFLPIRNLPPAGDRSGPMLAVGMMRERDKLASYRIIAETLHLLPPDTWRMTLVGDGPARTEVERLMAPFGDAVTFAGARAPEQMLQAYRDAALLFWPGVNEAFGMSYIEAQAQGLPVVAQDRPGVCDVLLRGDYPPVSRGAQGLADMALPLLKSQTLRHTTGDAARAYVAAHHLLPAASERLRNGLNTLGILQ